MVFLIIVLFTANKSTETVPSSPQLLSKLFPQTAVSDQAELEAEQEKKKREDEGLRFHKLDVIRVIVL